MAFSALLPVGAELRVAEPLGATELSEGCWLPEAAGPDAGAEPLALAALEAGTDPVALPEIGALDAGAEMTAADAVVGAVELAVPVDVELHPANSRPAAATHARGVRMTEVIMTAQYTAHVA